MFFPDAAIRETSCYEVTGRRGEGGERRETRGGWGGKRRMDKVEKKMGEGEDRKEERIEYRRRWEKERGKREERRD